MKKVQFNKHIREMRLYCKNMPAKSRLTVNYALYPLNYLPCSPRLITRQLNYIRSCTLFGDMIRLENVFMRDTGIIDFTLHVSNICFSKTVYIRYSVDNWKTHHEISCFYKKSSIPSTDIYFGVDEFSAMLDSHKLMLKENQDYSQMEFAICYQYDNKVLWNNNNSKNYSMAVYIKTAELQDVLETDSEYSEEMRSCDTISVHSVTSADNKTRLYKNRYSFDLNADKFVGQQIKHTLPPQQRTESRLFKATHIAPIYPSFPIYKEITELGTSPPIVMYY
eukprot:NODE_663_length_5420_cov_0.347679.p2 type:complete len:279 gc:universal NODE_663_length_5420_cov_0.347679:4963-4127(-)